MAQQGRQFKGEGKNAQKKLTGQKSLQDITLLGVEFYPLIRHTAVEGTRSTWGTD